jgi:hypothetical protein
VRHSGASYAVFRHQAEVPPDFASSTIAAVCSVAQGFAKRAATYDIRQATVRHMDALVQGNVRVLSNE